MLTFNRKLQLAAAGLGTAVLMAGCAVMAPKAERYVPPILGTTWERTQTDAGSYGSGSSKAVVRRGERMWQGEKVLTFEIPGSAIYARQDGAWLGFFKGDQALVTFDPPQNWAWPLEVGKMWSREQRMTIHAAKRTVPYKLTQKVEAYEDVTVPAGTFKTFKISTVTSLGDENLLWFSPELGIFVKIANKRTAKHPRGPGTRNVELLSYKRGG